jgi:hypothetical protein
MSEPEFINIGYHGKILLSCCRRALSNERRARMKGELDKLELIGKLHSSCYGRIYIPNMSINVVCSCYCHVRRRRRGGESNGGCRGEQFIQGPSG